MIFQAVLGVPGAVAVLLVAGHLAGEFVLGPEAAGRRVEGGRGHASHGAVVLVAHLAVLLLLPLTGVLPSSGVLPLAVAAGGLALLHLGVDAGVSRVTRRRAPAPIRVLVLDQLLHGGTLVVALVLLLPFLEVDPEATQLLPDVMACGVLVGALAFNVGGGATVTHAVLAGFRFPEDLLSRPRTEGTGGEGEPREGERGNANTIGVGIPGTGRAIGILERLILFPLVVLGAWGGFGFILAAKSLARFRELDSRPFAEYYLIGTLTSLLVAMVTGLVARAVLGI